MFDAIAGLTPGAGQRLLTTDERAEVDDILDAAAEWQAGRMDWRAVAGLGRLEINGAPSESYSRFVAVAMTPPGDPRRAALLAFLDVLVRAEGYIATRQGTFTRHETRMHDQAVAWVRAHERETA